MTTYWPELREGDRVEAPVPWPHGDGELHPGVVAGLKWVRGDLIVTVRYDDSELGERGVAAPYVRRPSVAWCDRCGYTARCPECSPPDPPAPDGGER